jgi:hypothetical protein
MTGLETVLAESGEEIPVIGRNGMVRCGETS